MPNVDHQATTLRPYIELHEAELTELRKREAVVREMLHHRPIREPKPLPSPALLKRDLESIQTKIAKHEEAIRLARQDNVGKLLQAVADNPEVAAQLTADPYAFAASNGFHLPDGVTIEVVTTATGVAMHISSLDPDMPFQITWTEAGFQMPS